MIRRTIATAFALSLFGCAGDQKQSDASSAGGSSSSVDLTGAGATFPYPIYSKWFADYAKQTGVKINYQSIGSGGGIRQLSEGTVDFGASDSPMTDEEIGRAKGPVLHIPTVIGSLAITYNLEGVSAPVRMSGDVVADIFLGRITKWNDRRIAAHNPGVTLPATDILVVHRSDGSGTTFVFTDYLGKISPAWASGPGTGKEVRWPTGLGAKGNEGVAGQVRQTPGSVGYVELAYARQNNLSLASIRNSSGAYVTPSVESVTAAAAGFLDQLPATSDYRISIVNAPGATAYPISSFTWILVYQKQEDAEKAKKLVDFLRWALKNGGPSAAALDYAPLPSVLVQQLGERLNTIAVGSSQ